MWKLSWTRKCQDSNNELDQLRFLYYSSVHLILHSPTITPLYSSSVHFIFHHPTITPIYYSSFHVIFHFPNILLRSCTEQPMLRELPLIRSLRPEPFGSRTYIGVALG